MAGHRPFSDLTKGWSPERRARHKALTAKIATEIAAAELTGQAATRDAIEELEAGEGTRFPNVDALMTDLHDDD